MSSKASPVKLVIVGGVAGGASAAARARRLNEKADITIVEKGPDVSFANCGLPYYIGGEITDRKRLQLHVPETLGKLIDTKILPNTEAVKIDRSSKLLKVKAIATRDAN